MNNNSSESRAAMIMRTVSDWRYLSGILIFAVLYYLAGRIGLALAFVHVSATAVWPPTGITLAILLLWGYRYWPGAFIGAFLANLVTAGTVLTSLGIAAGNTLEGIIGAYLITRLAGGVKAFDSPVNILRFTVLAGIVGPVISATIGFTSLALGDFASWTNFWPVWLTWILGDSTSALIITPLIILWSLPGRVKWNLSVAFEALMLFVSISIVGRTVFGGMYLPEIAHYPLMYLNAPVLLWAAFRFSAREAITATFLLSSMEILATLRGYGPFFDLPTNVSLLLLQLFIGINALIALSVAAIVYERKLATDNQKRRAAELELLTRRIAEQNKELRESELAMLNVLEDLSREKAIVEEAGAKNEALLASIGEGVIATDNTGSIIFMNSSAEQILGKLSAECLGRQISDIFVLLDKNRNLVPKELRPSTQVLEHGIRVVTDLNDGYCVESGSGPCIPLVLTVSPAIHDGRVIGIIKVFRDVTEQMKLDQAKSDFISIASHQLRTPLSALFWLVEVLQDSFKGGKKLNAKQQGYLQYTVSSVNRAVGLVEDLLNVSRIQLGTIAIKEELVNPVTAVNELIEGLHNYAEAKKHKIDIEAADNLPSVFIDKKMLYNVFQNLFANAVDYSPAGSTVKVSLAKERGFVKISVANHGPVIPKAEQGKLFEKFYRAESSRSMKTEGTGLGLFIVKSFVEGWGGKTGFSSQPQETVFWFTIPIK